MNKASPLRYWPFFMGTLLGALQSASLHLDADARDRHVAAGQVLLQCGQQLSQLGGHGVGADQEAPLAFIDGTGLDAGAQWGWQQGPYGLQTLTGGLHAIHQPGQGGGLPGGLVQGDGVAATVGFSHMGQFILQPNSSAVRPLTNR